MYTCLSLYSHPYKSPLYIALYIESATACSKLRCDEVADLLIAMAEFEPADMAVGPCKGFLQGLGCRGWISGFKVEGSASMQTFLLSSELKRARAEA